MAGQRRGGEEEEDAKAESRPGPRNQRPSKECFQENRGTAGQERPLGSGTRGLSTRGESGEGREGAQMSTGLRTSPDREDPGLGEGQRKC